MPVQEMHPLEAALEDGLRQSGKYFIIFLNYYKDPTGGDFSGKANKLAMWGSWATVDQAFMNNTVKGGHVFGRGHPPQKDELNEWRALGQVVHCTTVS